MRNDNTLTIGEYLYLNAGYMVTFFYSYSSLFFVNLMGYSHSDSKEFFIVMFIMCAIIGLWADHKVNRNGFSVFRNVVLGPGLYTIMAYWSLYHTVITIVLGIVTLLIVLFSSAVLLRKTHNKNKIRKIVKRRIVKSVTVSKNILCIGLMILMMVVFGIEMLNQHLVKESVPPTTPQFMSLEEYLTENRDIDVLTKPEIWRDMTIESRKQVLGIIVDLERGFLGIPNEIKILIDDLREGLVACYGDTQQTIILDQFSILNSDPYPPLRMVLHELFHCYQLRLVEVYDTVDGSLKGLQMYDTIRKYKWEFDNYKSHDQDSLAYAMQQIEKDAYSFAQERADKYMELISSHISSTGE